jgi:hypothetical protein
MPADVSVLKTSDQMHKPGILKNYFRLLFLLPLLVLPLAAFSQAQSGRVFEFLNLPATARITALGGYGFPDLDNDLGMALMYPSLLQPEFSNHLSLNVVDYFDDISYGTVAFSRSFERLGSFSGSVKYINYGQFIEADEVGETHGTFSAGEYAFMIGWGRRIGERLYIGSNLKSIHSFYYDTSAWGVGIDVSFTYLDPDKGLAAGALARNIGYQVIPFRKGNQEPMPFDLVLGGSLKLANAPFRFSLVAHNLHRFDLTYVSPSSLPASRFSPGPSTESFGDKLSELADKAMRHVVVGLEFLPSQNFGFRVGYNYRRRQEMKVDTRLSTVGLSWGFGFRVSRFQLNYGRSNYHLAGAPNHISVSTSISDLFHRPEQIPANE